LRLWIDILTPKQVRFFEPLIREYGETGAQIFVTTREYREVTGMFGLLGLRARSVGVHGGALRHGKLKASLERMALLRGQVEDFKPDVVLSFSSPEASRLAFGLGLPHVCVNDSPHAKAVARLTVPLATRLASPWIIPKVLWARFGISPKRVCTYRALDPAAWLKRRAAVARHTDIRTGLPPTPFFVFRAPETAAAYLPNSRAETLADRCLTALLSAFPKHHILLLPRYDQARAWKARHSGPRIAIAESVLDTVRVLPTAAAFIGMGGTMTAEACLLGVPSLSAYPGSSPLVEHYLLRRGLLRRADSPEQMVRALRDLLVPAKRHALGRRAARLLEWMEDPLDTIRALLHSVSRKR
jgi:hypothetical protein